jgi:hypothetical protein
MAPGGVAALAAVFFTTSVIGAVTGGQSLINVPALTLGGLGTRQAIATNMFAIAFLSLAAGARFLRERLVPGRLAAGMTALAVATSLVGAQLTVRLPERVVKIVVVCSMAAVLSFLLVRGKRPPPTVAPRPAVRLLGWIAAAVLGVYGGLFSGGYSTLLTFVCVAAFGLPLMQAVALTKIVNLGSCIAATGVFLHAGLVDLRLAVPLALFATLGGWLGAHLAIKRGEAFVRVLFLVVVSGLAAKLLVDTALGR